MPESLEAAWQAFLRRDHPATSALVLVNAELDDERFTKLQQSAQSGKPKARAKAAEELAEIGAEIGSALVLDALAASAFDALDRKEEALALRVRALACTPAWQPLEVGRVVGNIGWNLFSLGRLDEAVRWLERALLWDPVDPFVLCNLGEAHAAAGSLPTARALAAYLSPRYPAAHVADLVRALEKAGAGGGAVEPFRPRADRLHALDRTSAGRFVTAVSFDDNQIDKSALRSHAIVAAMCGRLEYALLSAELSVQCAWTGIEARAPIEDAWSRALVEALEAREDAARAERLPADPEERFAALDAARRAGDRERLTAAIHEPEVGLRMGAAAMIAISLGGDELDGWLGEQAEIESARNLDVRPFADVGWTASAILQGRRAARGLAGTPLSVVPREGAEQPTLGAFAAGDVLMMWIQFAVPPEPDERAALQSALGRGDEALASRGIHPLVEGFEDPLTLQLAFGGEMDPALVARTYLAELRDPALKIRDVVIGRFADPSVSRDEDRDDDESDDDDEAVRPSLRAVDDPRSSTEYGLEGDEWWAASFDPGRTAPACEPEAGLLMMVPSGEGYAAELRLCAPIFPEARVCFGLAEVEYVQVPRTDAVTSALRAALERTFRGAPPGFRDVEGVAGKIDGISAHGRQGWALAVPQLTPAMVQHLPRSVRFREHELLGALAEVVRELSLAPVIHWYRGDGLYVLNLWDAAPR